MCVSEIGRFEDCKSVRVLYWKIGRMLECMIGRVYGWKSVGWKIVCERENGWMCDFMVFILNIIF